MSLQVLGFTQDESSGKRCVTVENDNDGSPGREFGLAITELQGPETRTLAIKYAAEHGVTNARCELPTAPYPVDQDGAVVVNPIQQKVRRYRVDVPISQGLGAL